MYTLSTFAHLDIKYGTMGFSSMTVAASRLAGTLNLLRVCTLKPCNALTQMDGSAKKWPGDKIYLAARVLVLSFAQI